MSDFDLFEDFLAFIHSTDDGGNKRDGEFCDCCGAELEYDPDSGEERCPECDAEA